MFLLPNGNKIDEEGVIDALSDYARTAHYFLDSVTGDVGVIAFVQYKKLQRIKKDTRYFEIPPVSAERQLESLQGFMKAMLPKRNKLAHTLKIQIENKNAKIALAACEDILEKNDDWVHAWGPWQGDFLFEEAQQWFSTLPVSIVEKFEGCDDCEMCKLFEKGEHTIGDFFEVAQQEKSKQKQGGFFTNFDTENIDNLYYDAMELLDISKVPQAIILLKQALTVDINSVQTLLGLASAYRIKGDKEQFHEYANRAFAETRKKFKTWPKKLLWGYIENREYLRAMQCQAEILCDSGKKDESIKLYKLLLKLNPNDNQGVRYVLAGIYAGISGDDINKMTDEGNVKQNWSNLEDLVNNQNAKHHFWKEPK